MAVSAIVCFATSATYASDAEVMQTKIGVVDFQKIIESSSAYQDIRSQLDKKTDAFRSNATKIEEKLQKGYQELDSQKSVLSGEAYSKKRKALDKEVETSQEKFHMERLSLDKASSQAMAILEKKLFEIVEENAKIRDLSVVLASSSLIYSHSSLDITDIVVEQLNKKLSSVAVNFEDAADNKMQKSDGKAGKKAKK